MIDFSLLYRLSEPPASEADANADTGTLQRPGSIYRGPKQKDQVVTRAEFERYRASVRNDLEWLLNTRRTSEPVPDGLKEIERSVFYYGLPEFSQTGLQPASSEGDRAVLAAMITRAIELFEPRILDVRVTVEDRPDAGRSVRFNVAGRLRMKPRPEPVCYDTLLDATRGDFSVAVAGEAHA